MLNNFTGHVVLAILGLLFWIDDVIDRAIENLFAVIALSFLLFVYGIDWLHTRFTKLTTH